MRNSANRKVIVGVALAATACVMAVLAGGLMTGPAAAEAPSAGLETKWIDGHAHRVRMIAGRMPSESGRAGIQVVAGVEIELEPGWKTYWRVPGEAGGVPPAFDLSQSKNVAEALVLYPAPKRLTDVIGDTIGYKERVVFPVQVTPADPGKPVELVLEFAFGVCRDICIPADANLAVDVPSDSVGGLPTAILEALDHVPRTEATKRPGDPEVARYETNFSGKQPSVVIDIDFGEKADKGDMFAAAPDGLYLPMARPVQGSGLEEAGRKRFIIDLSETIDADELKGKTITLTLVGAKGQSERTLVLE
ncbi:MAG: hypothetical protein KJ622_08680 [Alphaproteobacteria bacterium]|nr:hypothetical protein [Alphaproteobacteria bacterium]